MHDDAHDRNEDEFEMSEEGLSVFDDTYEDEVEDDDPLDEDADDDADEESADSLDI